MTIAGQLAEQADLLLPARLRRELRIGDVRTDLYRDVIVFRMDPGQLFERLGIICPTRSGSFTTSIGQRNVPDDELTWLADATGVNAARLAGELRGALAHARLASAQIPHWRAGAYRHPAFVLDWPLTGPARAAAATGCAAGRARYTGSTHFAYQRGDRAYAASTAPRDGTFFSITPQGLWATHRGTRTAPLPAAPGTWLFTPPGPAASRVAARDQPGPGLADPTQAISQEVHHARITPGQRRRDLAR